MREHRERYEAELDAEVDRELAAAGVERAEPAEGVQERLARLEREAGQERALRDAASKPPAMMPPTGGIMQPTLFVFAGLHIRDTRARTAGTDTRLPSRRPRGIGEHRRSEKPDDTVRRARELCLTHEEAARVAAERRTGRPWRAADRRGPRGGCGMSVELREAGGKVHLTVYPCVTGSTGYDMGSYEEVVRAGAFKATLGNEPGPDCSCFWNTKRAWRLPVRRISGSDSPTLAVSARPSGATRGRGTVTR